MTAEVWKVTFTAIFLRNKVVHSALCVIAIRCMHHCADGQSFSSTVYTTLEVAYHLNKINNSVYLSVCIDLIQNLEVL